MRDVVLVAAARHGDRVLFDRMRAQAKKETDENARVTLLVALGSFRDPAIVKTAMAIVLTDEFDNNESIDILFAARRLPENRDLAYDFVKRNWEPFVAKLPTDFGAFLLFIASHYCDSQHKGNAEAFFKDRAAKYAGGPRHLAQVLESVSLGAANKDANEASVAEFLKRY